MVGSQNPERAVMQPEVESPAIRELIAGHDIGRRAGGLEPVHHVRLNKRRGFQRRHRPAQHLGPFQVDHCQAAGIVVGGQQDSAVRVKGHVHRPPAELQEFLRLELGVKNRTLVTIRYFPSGL
jgi:hypothetical protein